MRSVAALLLMILAACPLLAQEATAFRWASRGADRALFRQVERAFRKELTPGTKGLKPKAAPLSGRSIDRIALQGDAALVILGFKEDRTEQYPNYGVYSYNLATHAKRAMLGMGDAKKPGDSWFPLLKFVKQTHLLGDGGTDLLFEFATCTYCEATTILADFHLSPQAKGWEPLRWSRQDGVNLVIGYDPAINEQSGNQFDCLHVTGDFNGDGLDDVAVRCRESADHGNRGTRSVRDTTYLYTAQSGVMQRTAVTPETPGAELIRQALCATNSKSKLCRVPMKHAAR
jgi:hypothetical protein